MRFTGRRLVLTIVGLLVLVGLIAGSAFFGKGGAPLPQRFVNDVVGFGSRLVSSPGKAVGRSADALGNGLNVYQENKKLRSKVDSLAQTKVQLRVLTKENKSLKKTMKLASTLTDYQTVKASVISRSPTTWNNELIINRGLNSHLKVGMPVMAGKGVIGRISQVNNTNAKVSLISDVQSGADRFPVAIQGNGGDVHGLITGYKRSKGYLIMGQLSSDLTLHKGDLVQTSGLGGVMPEGLYVGKVVKVANDDYGLSKRVYIQPASDLSNVTAVLVAIQGNE